MPTPEVEFYPDWLDSAQADKLFECLMNEIPWRQGQVKIFGQWHTVPRLQSWHGDPGASYTYSGKQLSPEPWTESLNQLRIRLLERGFNVNSVLCNLYRNGQDRMGWHRDNEPELGESPIIVSLSLGAERDFKLRHISTKTVQSIALTHGSLLIMRGETQRDWQHSLPARKKVTEPRINLTFRTVYNRA